MKQKKIFILCMLLCLAGIVNAQSMSELGKKLTKWTLSSDSRRSSVNRILLYEYPGSDNSDLLKKIDNFGNNPSDTKMVLVGLYKNNGPDYGYMILRDYFSKKELAAIDAIYEANGGTIKKYRTEEDRKKGNETARMKGITADIAKQLSWWCNNTPNTIYYVSNALSERGFGDMGYYRIMDAFEENLDYAEAVLMSVCEMSGGADQAYPILRTFLNQNQISLVVGLYAKYKTEKKAKREEAIQKLEEQALDNEPYAIDERELESIKNKANEKVLQLLDKRDRKNVAISIIDQVSIGRSDTTNHNLVVNIEPMDNQLKEAIVREIKTIKGHPKVIHNEKLDYRLLVASKGIFNVDINQHVDTTVMQIRIVRDSWGFAEPVLVEGNKAVFESEIKTIETFIKQKNLTGKKKIKMIKCSTNEKAKVVSIDLADKKEPIR